jgi:LemA protein
MITVIVLLAVAAVLAVYFIGIYNSLVAIRERVKQSWANIDVLLRQRHDELPKLIETCRQYMQYEQETLEKRGDIGRLFAVAENYPQLKTDESFRQLQARITGLEEAIADRRELYNDQVNINNTRIDQFPDVLIAHRYGFTAKPLLEFAAAEKTDVDVGALFKR